jgi:NAD(P)-dependent dehydrogenase (short-subunit alcohol dehydrogenase family)
MMKDKVALVSGGASGIGADVCRRLAAAGARVTVLDVDEARGTALADEIGARFVRCNVADRNDWDAAVTGCIEALGVPDYAHLNAGVMSVGADQPFVALDALPLERYRRIVGVNLDGVVFGLQALLPHMRGRAGAITVTASLVGLVPLPIDPMYSATKHALVGLVRSVAASMPDDPLRINAICPGGVDTPIVPAALREQGMAMMPVGVLADEVLDLLERGPSGEIRLRASADEPARAVPIPDLD